MILDPEVQKQVIEWLEKLKKLDDEFSSFEEKEVTEEVIARKEAIIIEITELNKEVIAYGNVRKNIIRK